MEIREHTATIRVYMKIMEMIVAPAMNSSRSLIEAKTKVRRRASSERKQ